MLILRTYRVAFFFACSLLILATLSLAQQSSTRNRSLKFIPRDAIAVVSVDVKSLMASQMLSASATQIGEQVPPAVKIPLSKITDFTFVVLNNGAYAKFNFAGDGKQLLWKRVSAMGKETVLEGVKHFKNRDGVFHQLEDGSTLIANNEATLFRALKTESAETTTWANQWKAAKSPVVALVNTSLLRGETPTYEKLFFGQYGNVPINREVVSVVSKSERVWIEFQPDPVPALSVRGQSASPEEAVSFEGGLRTAISVARNQLSAARTEAVKPHTSINGEPIQIIDFLDKFLEFATVQRKESQVAGLARVSDADSKKVPNLFSLALKNFTTGSEIASAQINLKRIALAMHNYHDAYKRFPAAVQEGPKKMPRSWRVTILPYLEQTALYNRYKQDEPWDSPSNLKLLEEIPTVYQGNLGGTNSAYYVFDGVNAIFNGNKGTGMNEVRDGLANTILAVQADLDIPWTKPEDIPFDANQELPDFLKSGFQVATADATCHNVPPNADEKLVKQAIIQKDGGGSELFQRE